MIVVGYEANDEHFRFKRAYHEMSPFPEVSDEAAKRICAHGTYLLGDVEWGTLETMANLYNVVASLDHLQWNLKGHESDDAWLNGIHHGDRLLQGVFCVNGWTKQVSEVAPFGFDEIERRVKAKGQELFEAAVTEMLFPPAVTSFEEYCAQRRASFEEPSKSADPRIETWLALGDTEENLESECEI